MERLWPKKELHRRLEAKNLQDLQQPRRKIQCPIGHNHDGRLLKSCSNYHTLAIYI
jgi:hypothetical protein